MLGEPLDLTRTQGFAETLYGITVTEYQQPVYKHAAQVAELAQDVLTQHFRALGGFLRLEQRMSVVTGVHAGWLHEAVERCGCTYEQIAAVTDLATATLVTECSRDNRLPGPRRCLDYRSRISQLGPLSQILILCDTLCAVRATTAWFACDDSLAAEAYLVEAGPRWENELTAMHQLARHSVPLQYIRETRQLLDALGGQVAQRVQHRKIKATIARRKKEQQ